MRRLLWLVMFLSLVQRLVLVFVLLRAYAKHGDNVLISGRRAELLGEVQARLSKGIWRAC